MIPSDKELVLPSIIRTHPSMIKPVVVASTAFTIFVQTISQEELHYVVCDSKVTEDTVRAK